MAMGGVRPNLPLQVRPTQSFHVLREQTKMTAALHQRALSKLPANLSLVLDEFARSIEVAFTSRLGRANSV